MVEIKTPGEIQAMRGAGQVVAQILAAVQDQAKAGMRLAELDEVARDVLARAGAFSPFLGYQPGFAPVPFPAAICTSVNDAALHGIPGRYKLADGDLLSVDCGAVLDGWAADAAVSFTIGPPRTGRRAPDRRHPGRPHKRASPRRFPARGSGTSPRPSAPPGARRATGSAPISAATASAGPCTRIRTSPTRVPRPRPPARPRAGHRDRAVVPGRRQGHLPDRP